MAEYIEKDELIKEGWHLERTKSGDGFINIERREIKDIPAADVREVVLCEDCKHCKDGFICNNGHWNGMTFPSNFCSDGERKNQRGHAGGNK